MKNTTISSPKERLIFALDVGAGMEDALSWVDRLRDHVGLFKVGKESFVRFGTEIVRQIRARGGGIFLDLKFHDIPNTVARAAEAACGLGVAMFNLHALGGVRMMTDAVDAVREFAERYQEKPPAVLAVTILTSLNDDDLKLLGFSGGTRETALHLARLSQDAGLSGVVAAAEDAAAAPADGGIVIRNGKRYRRVRVRSRSSRRHHRRHLGPSVFDNLLSFGQWVRYSVRSWLLTR